MANKLIHEGNFLIEISGVGTLRAQEFDPPESKHEPFEVHTGDSNVPTLGDGKYSFSEGTVKAALGLGTAAADLNAMYQKHKQRIDLGRFFVRAINLESDGRTQAGSDEWVDCVIVSMKPSAKKAAGKEAAMFDFKFKPSDHAPSY